MENNKKKFVEDFFKEQAKTEKMIWEVEKLMEDLYELERESLKKVFDNKIKFERLFSYLKTFNSYDYEKLAILYKIAWNQQKLIKWLNTFSNDLQDFTFQLNIFTNAFVEDLVIYEMAEKFLDKKDLELSFDNIFDKLLKIKTEDRLQFIREKLWRMTWVKNFKSTLMLIFRSEMPLKFSYYYFAKTNWKLKVLSDCKNYLFYRQLYYKYEKYLEELLEYDDTENMDIISLNLSQMFVIRKDIKALHAFISWMYTLLLNYSMNIWDSRVILRYFVSSFWINYLPSWDVKIKWFDNLPEEFTIHLKGICSILFKNKYSELIEKYKSKYNLTDEEFEIFKDFRFISIFKEWNSFSNILKKIIESWIFNKLKNDVYFDVLYNYWLEFSSVFWSYWDFVITEIKRIFFKIKYILNDKENGLSLFFINDLNYMKEGIEDFLKSNKIKY